MKPCGAAVVENRARNCTSLSFELAGFEWRVAEKRDILPGHWSILSPGSLTRHSPLATRHCSEPLLRFLEISRRDDGKLLGVDVLAEGGVDRLDGQTP